MTINPTYAELLGRELQRDRFQEAEKERLINLAINRKPVHRSRKIKSTLKTHWRTFWNRISRKREYISISGVPSKTPSL